MAESGSGGIRIQAGEILVGEPLPWSIIDGAGVLLLSKGFVMGSQRQIDGLIERGAYQKRDAQSASLVQAAQPAVSNSPFHRYDALQSRLKLICENLESLPGAGLVAPEQITELCADVQELCSLDGDALLAAVHMVHSGRDSVIHALHSVTLTEMLLDSHKVSEEERLSILAAALTQNVGMMALHDNLCKQSEPLTEGQKREIRQHPIKGVEALEKMGVKDDLWLKTVLHHHERLDGSGYPEGIKDEAIIMSVRIISIVDIYCALVKPRAYRPGFHALGALREIFQKRAGNVDERITKLFIKELGIYPPGAFVRLGNGEIGIVTRRGKAGAPPDVCSVIGARGALLDKPIKRDTARNDFKIKEIVDRDKSISLSVHDLWEYA